MSRINWYDANRDFSVNVANYMVCVFWKKAVALKFAGELKEAREGLAKVDNLKGSIMADRIPELKKYYLARIGELEEQKAEQIRCEGTYTPSVADTALKRALEAYVKGKTDKTPAESLKIWFASYGLDLEEDNPVITEILRAAGEKNDFRTAVRTDAKVVTDFNAGNCYKMAFSKCYEHMVNAHTIKAVQIPEIIREKYAPKKASKKNGKK